MASKDVATSSSGIWRIVIDQVSQDAAANTSRVRVRGILLKTNGYRSWTSSNVPYSITGTNSYHTSGPFDVPAYGSDTVIDVTFTVAHDSAGYKTVGFTATLGNTGTSAFGSGASVYLAMSLTRIPKPPAKIANPTRSFQPPNSVRIDWLQPDNNGAGIHFYEAWADDNTSYSSAMISGPLKTQYHIFKGLSINKVWNFRVRAHNAMGPGPWSNSTAYFVPDVPVTMAKPELFYEPPSTMKVTYTAPTSNGGATVTSYEIQYADNAAYSNATLVTGKTISGTVINALEVGKTWYFRVRARNSQGVGAWSPSAYMLVVCGPRILVGSVWKSTVSYVNVNGVWKLAIPYVNQNGIWKVGAG